MKQVVLPLSPDSLMDVYNLAEGVFAPLTGFLGARDYQSVVNDKRLVSGAVWTVPITLEVPEEQLEEVRKVDQALLCSSQGDLVAKVYVEDIYRVDLASDLIKIFKTDSSKHPGATKEMNRSPYRVGGRIELLGVINRQDEDYLSPEQTKTLFAQKGWKKIVGFQTRNPLHRAHEYLQRVALEVGDGLFIQPLSGWKKKGDFTKEAVFSAYQKMIETNYPESRVVLGPLQTAMRYAGPREAVFHALIRKNFGCTHFIIGRDHAGVGGFYGKYEAQEMAKSFPDLGIEILALGGPFYCFKCLGLATEHSCGHAEEHRLDISGTQIREFLSKGERPPKEFMRDEVFEVLLKLQQKNQLFYE